MNQRAWSRVILAILLLLSLGAMPVLAEKIASQDYWYDAVDVKGRTWYIQITVAVLAVTIVVFVAGRIIRELLASMIVLGFQFYSQAELRSDFLGTLSNNFKLAMSGQGDHVVYVFGWIVLAALLIVLFFGLGGAVGVSKSSSERVNKGGIKFD